MAIPFSELYIRAKRQKKQVRSWAVCFGRLGSALRVRSLPSDSKSPSPESVQLDALLSEMQMVDGHPSWPEPFQRPSDATYTHTDVDFAVLILAYNILRFATTSSSRSAIQPYFRHGSSPRWPPLSRQSPRTPWYDYYGYSADQWASSVYAVHSFVDRKMYDQGKGSNKPLRRPPQATPKVTEVFIVFESGRDTEYSGPMSPDTLSECQPPNTEGLTFYRDANLATMAIKGSLNISNEIMSYSAMNNLQVQDKLVRRYSARFNFFSAFGGNPSSHPLPPLSDGEAELLLSMGIGAPQDDPLRLSSSPELVDSPLTVPDSCTHLDVMDMLRLAVQAIGHPPLDYSVVPTGQTSLAIPQGPSTSAITLSQLVDAYHIRSREGSALPASLLLYPSCMEPYPVPLAVLQMEAFTATAGDQCRDPSENLPSLMIVPDGKIRPVCECISRNFGHTIVQTYLVDPFGGRNSAVSGGPGFPRKRIITIDELFTKLDHLAVESDNHNVSNMFLFRLSSNDIATFCVGLSSSLYPLISISCLPNSFYLDDSGADSTSSFGLGR